MKKLLLAGVAALLLLTETAHAQRRIFLGMQPPPEYDKLYAGKVTIRRIETEEEIVKICPKANTRIACTHHPVEDFSFCNLYIANDNVLRKHGFTFAFVLHHELGHCNGWSANHERARKVEVATVRTLPTLPKETQVLPTYPPVTCVTPDWKSEPCENRKPKDIWSTVRPFQMNDLPKKVER